MNIGFNSYLVHFSPNQPLENALFQKILKAIPVDLPLEYVEFMREYNGGEGRIGQDGKYVRFWPLEELIEANEDYLVRDFAPGLFFIGSDGGDTALGIRLSAKSFIEVPFIGMADDEAIDRATGFENFLSYLESVHY